MVFHHCIRCEKQIRKYAKKIGFGADYIRVFLKAEHGLCDEELNNGYLCNPCRSFIYGVVHRPGPGKSTSDPSRSKRASSDSVAAAAAAVFAADQAKKKKEEEAKKKKGEAPGPTQSHYFKTNEGTLSFLILIDREAGR